MSIYEQLRPIFYPKSIAIVGISLTNPNHLSRPFFEALLDLDFQGQIYLVNPKGGEIGGHKVYQSLAEVPGEVGLVISTVTARVAPTLMKECANKGVKVVHFFTSGFAETGEEEGIRLEAEIAKIAQETGIRIVGPNCMGAYCPESGVAFDVAFPRESGTVGFITQSGSNAYRLIKEASWRGVRFSKIISYGNACDLNETDFLKYLTEDPKTSIIAMYLEGVKDGSRFLRAVQMAAREKTVILLKGGVTSGGAQATMGHTGALAGSETAWDAVCKQYGLIRVNTMEELTDVLVTLLFFPLPKSRNAILMGGGGGQSVMIADQFEKNGLIVPPLPQDIRDNIRSFTPIAGMSLRNPIDYLPNIKEIDKLIKTVNIVMGWRGGDFLATFFHVRMTVLKDKAILPEIIKEIHGANAGHNKPMAVILDSSMPDKEGIMFPTIQKIAATQVPVYLSAEGAARGIDRVLKHYNL